MTGSNGHLHLSPASPSAAAAARPASSHCSGNGGHVLCRAKHAPRAPRDFPTSFPPPPPFFLQGGDRGGCEKGLGWGGGVEGGGELHGREGYSL